MTNARMCVSTKSPLLFINVLLRSLSPVPLSNAMKMQIVLATIPHKQSASSSQVTLLDSVNHSPRLEITVQLILNVRPNIPVSALMCASSTLSSAVLAIWIVRLDNSATTMTTMSPLNKEGTSASSRSLPNSLIVLSRNIVLLLLITVILLMLPPSPIGSALLRKQMQLPVLLTMNAPPLIASVLSVWLHLLLMELPVMKMLTVLHPAGAPLHSVKLKLHLEAPALLELINVLYPLNNVSLLITQALISHAPSSTSPLNIVLLILTVRALSTVTQTPSVS